MKQNFAVLIASLCITAAAMIHTNTYGQTLIAPSLTDNYWVTGGVTGINTALIDIGNWGTDNLNHGTKQLGACAYDGGGGGVVVTDFNSGLSVNTSFPISTGLGGSGYAIVGEPDVIIGNMTNDDSDFIMAVAFVNNSYPQQVEVDYFNIHYATHTTFTVTFNSYQVVGPPVGDTSLGTVHIDVVAQSSVMVPTGVSTNTLPYCDLFFVTYDARDPYDNYQVFATQGSLNAYNALVQGPVNISFESCASFGEETFEPDVAGIERYDIGSGTYHIVACLTYVMKPSVSLLCPEINSYWLYYSEWDTYPGLSCAFQNYITLDGNNALCSSGNDPSFAYPRIDADDDYITNGIGACESKVVCEYYAPPGYSPGTLPITGIYSPFLSHTGATFGGVTTSAWNNDMALPPPGPYGLRGITNPYGYYMPTVAYGQNNRSEFMVMECTELPALASPDDFFVMSPVDRLNSGSCSLPGGGLSEAPSTAYDYFEVNYTYPAISSNYANAVSTPCNNVTDTSLVAWTNGGDIYYKRSGYDPSGGAGYAYRTSGSAVTKGKDVKIYPDPADEMLTISNGLDADNYSIHNLLGRQVMQGALIPGTQQINVDGLTPGSYIISFAKGNMPAGNNIFVKR